MQPISELERRHLEEQLSTAREELAEMRDKLAAILEVLVQAAVMSATSGNPRERAEVGG